MIGALYSNDTETGVNYEVPLRDSGPPRASTGGYPVRLDGDYTTIVSITNTAEKPGDFTMQLHYDGGVYVFGMVSMDAGETKTFDIRNIRDQQTPDVNGGQLPSEMQKGLIRWSARGNGSVSLMGRSEVVSLNEGVSSSYSCWQCCQYSFYTAFIVPTYSTNVVVGGHQYFIAQEQQRDCYWNIFAPYPYYNGVWSSDTESVATVDWSSGVATGVGPGFASISCEWDGYIWEWDDADEWCEPFEVPADPGGDMNVVGISEIKYQADSGLVAISGTLYILKDTAVTFQAIPNPTSGTFPNNQPVWSGTSGASGTGATESVTFNTLSSSVSDFKTVIATAGTNAITVNVVVYDLTGVLTPEITFTGRSLIRFGIEEEVSLSFTASPSITAAQAGGLKWKIVTTGLGNGTISANTSGTGTYNAPDANKSVTLGLEVLGGPSKNQKKDVPITIVRPDNGFVVKAIGTSLKHINNTWSCGFLGDIYVTPSDVSFYNHEFYEGSAAPHSSFWLLNFPPSHPLGSPARIESTNRVHVSDEIYSGAKEGPYGAGEWYWDIPWNIRTKTSQQFFNFATKKQLSPADNAGKAIISKGGHSEMRVPSDPTSNY